MVLIPARRGLHAPPALSGLYRTDSDEPTLLGRPAHSPRVPDLPVTVTQPIDRSTVQHDEAGGTEHQDPWALDSMVEKFAYKTVGDFFESETHFMPVVASARSVLDVGCASGRLVELLNDHLGPDFDFTGIDLVTGSIEKAKERYPQHDFHTGDYLELGIAGPFDFVNATGVVQHDPRYRQVIAQMIEDAARWVLFDAKLARIEADLIDRQRSYVTIEDTVLYFNVLAYAPFMDWLQDQERVQSVSAYGYQTEPNARTTVPSDLGPIASVGILLTLDDNGEEAGELSLPAFLQG